MKLYSFLIACGVLFSSSVILAESPTKPPSEVDMTSIFNGKNLDGWDGDPRLWSVRDGVIHGETTDETKAKGNTFLIWNEGHTGDFELRLSFRCNATNNSGIQYRSKHIKASSASNEWVMQGYQHELRNEIKFPNVSGFIYDEGGKRKRICLVGERAVYTVQGKQIEAEFLTQAEFENVFKLDDWNDVIIIAQGNRLQHFMNGQLILDCTDADLSLALLDGMLGLQLHAGKPMWTEFRDIRIKDLKPL